MNIKAIFISAKRIVIICAIAALAVALGGKTSAATIDYSPQFKEAARYSTTIQHFARLRDTVTAVSKIISDLLT